MSQAPVLLFVYNADSGLFNTFADIGHKLFSPSTYACALCALTHGYFHERAAWRAFVDGLPCTCEFLHRDQFLARFPGRQDKLPAVFVVDGRDAKQALSAAQIAGCPDLDALQQSIRDTCARLRAGATDGG